MGGIWLSPLKDGPCWDFYKKRSKKCILDLGNAVAAHHS